MQFGRAYHRAVGLGVCGVAIAVGAFAPFGDATTATLDLRGFGSAGDGTSDSSQESPPPHGGSLAATVSWPRAAAGLDAGDICVVVYDADGGVVDEGVDAVSAVPGQPVAARWAAGGLAEGRYTLYVAQCPTAADGARRWVEPQYLGGAAEAEAASWVEVVEGERVDVGTIALHAAALETWPQS